MAAIRAEIVFPEPDLFEMAQLMRHGFLASYGNAGTRRNYSEALTLWGRFCFANDVHPLKVVRAHIELWARTMEDAGLKPATVLARLIAVRGYYRYGHEEGMIDRDPAVHVRLPHVDTKTSTSWLDRSEMGILIRFAKLTEDPRTYALVSLLCYNALRISEALAINVEHIGEQRGHRVVQIQGKGDKPDLIPITPPLWRALDSYIGDRRLGPLFLDRKGTVRLPMSTAQRLIVRTAAAAGFERRITPHSLRHSSITASLDAGTDLRSAQVFARHADPRTTNRYDHTSDNLDIHASYTVARFVAGAT